MAFALLLEDVRVSTTRRSAPGSCIDGAGLALNRQPRRRPGAHLSQLARAKSCPGG